MNETEDQARVEAAAKDASEKEWGEYQIHLQIGGKPLHVRSFHQLGFKAGVAWAREDMRNIVALHVGKEGEVQLVRETPQETEMRANPSPKVARLILALEHYRALEDETGIAKAALDEFRKEGT